MDNIKPWQIAIFAVAIVAIVVSFTLTQCRGDNVRMQHEMVLVDVKSGALYRVSARRERPILPPERHPETGEHSLMPVSQDSDGRWMILQRHLPMIAEMDVSPDAIDMSTGAVSTEGSPSRLRLD